MTPALGDGNVMDGPASIFLQNTPQPMPMTATSQVDSSLRMLDGTRLNTTDTMVREVPFPFLVAPNLLSPELADQLDRDFPNYRSAGFFPFDPDDCGPSINTLVAELTAPALADAIGARLGVPDLGNFPTLVTISRLLNRTHGNIHTDSRSKIVTALLYLNRDWPQTSGGCLRFLERIDDMNSLAAPEVRPLFGTLAAFRRADNSFHGHLPHQGERRVIQVAWVTSEKEKLRKTKRGKVSRLVKMLSGLMSPRRSAGDRH